MLDAAIEAAGWGFKVFPVYGKADQLLRCWKDEASTDVRQVEDWWTRWPDANIAVNLARSSLMVVDVDGIVGHQTLRQYPPLPETATATTGRPMGRHYYYRTASRSFPATLGPKVDLKHRGYTLLPPSVHPNGNLYKWYNDLPAAVAPSWLPSQVKPRRIEMPVPSHDLNSKAAEIDQTLLRHGWERARGGWRHPRATSPVSATLTTHGNLRVWSPNTPFEPDRSYTPQWVRRVLDGP